MSLQTALPGSKPSFRRTQTQPHGLSIHVSREWMMGYMPEVTGPRLSWGHLTASGETSPHPPPTALGQAFHVVQWEPTCQYRRLRRPRFSRVSKVPWRREWQPILVFLPGESHGQRSLAGYSPRSCRESDTTVTKQARTLRATLWAQGWPSARRLLFWHPRQSAPFSLKNVSIWTKKYIYIHWPLEDEDFSSCSLMWISGIVPSG